MKLHYSVFLSTWIKPWFIGKNGTRRLCSRKNIQIKTFLPYYMIRCMQLFYITYGIHFFRVISSYALKAVSIKYTTNMRITMYIENSPEKPTEAIHQIIKTDHFPKNCKNSKELYFGKIKIKNLLKTIMLIAIPEMHEIDKWTLIVRRIRASLRKTHVPMQYPSFN